MPSFSVPYASHVTCDLETYYASRQEQQSRNQAAKGLSLESYSYQTLRRLDQRINTRSLILKACQPLPHLEHLFGYPCVQAFLGTTTPVATLNRHYLEEHGRAWLFGNPAWLYRKTIAGTRSPHNVSNPGKPLCAIDSS